MVLGLFTRWAGILCAITFAGKIALFDWPDGPRAIFPSGCLVVIGLYLGTYGAGRFSLDAVLRGNDLPRSTGGIRFKS
jgi:putative oxidoreductase